MMSFVARLVVMCELLLHSGIIRVLIFFAWFVVLLGRYLHGHIPDV